MCRLLAYLGRPLQLDHVLLEPEHSLVVQSYQPRKMQEALLNADGFGVGWYDTDAERLPYRYRHTYPIWNDINLSDLARYVQSQQMLAYVRSATPGLPVDLGNCQPFAHEQRLFCHNGYIENFRHTLRRPLHDLLSASAEQWIQGVTDSEYLSALILTYLETVPLVAALTQALQTVTKLAQNPFCKFAATLVISERDRLVACRYANFDNYPTLYWIKNAPGYPDSVILASEPLFPGSWHPCTPRSILTVEADLDVQSTPL
ncbi:MAG: ergothioneine biosynthesis protein EgtC [Spirulina sp. SIO3F2]|nr:ergothioneine biosynthesis protein EgtC [Spirulina sp. SIO3F2]